MIFNYAGVFLTQAVTEKAEETAEEIEKKILWFGGIRDKLIEGALAFAFKIVIALLIYFIGKKVIKWILSFTKRCIQRTNVEEGVSKFILSLMRAILYVILFVSIIGQLGMPTTSFVAILGSAGVTIGLALQGSLSNFAGGILILLLKPFRVGDYIIVSGLEGTVLGIDIFYTKLLTGDNRYVVIPNGSLSNSNLINVTNEPVRRLDLLIDVDYSSNIKKVREILQKIAADSEFVLQEEHQSDIYVNSFEASSIQMGYRVWVKTEDYFKAKCAILENVKETFDKENISIPFNQLDVRVQK
ncbi:mechanosensitive ion channel family protein [[Clostridium] polysaccharolyticum]|uniref:Small conductance mechanosensitive channel n=1 Tax=[Clostridium] polysaccharolyticum TaxID=29364 RepID=A0A1I0DM86_9FIRM|nr:mechanosensitive ion channel domain-containing protein [[Clostridium] polysaccharolyticum]SET33621.1 small conductance mechanosensitive channel [[Clostridium] polysaccharolyticum]